MRYVHEVKPNVYIGNGCEGLVKDINQAKVFNTPRSIKQTYNWHSYGGKIKPVQITINLCGDAVDSKPCNKSFPDYLKGF